MIVFTFRYFYMKFQKVQYILAIVLSHALFSVSVYLAALFIIGKSDRVSEDVLMKITLISLSSMVLVVIVTIIRFIILLNEGAYRKGTAKYVQRTEHEGSSYMTIIGVATIGLVVVLEMMISPFGFGGHQRVVIILSFLVVHIMSFVLPVQLVILYCKYRFKSFNFD